MYRGSMCSNMILSYHLNPLCMNLLFLTHKFLIFLLDSHWLEVVQTWSRLSFKFRHRHDPLAVCIKSTEEAIWLPQYIPCLKVFREPWTSGFKTISKNGHLRVWYVSKPIAFLWNLNVSNIDLLFVSCEVAFGIELTWATTIYTGDTSYKTSNRHRQSLHHSDGHPFCFNDICELRRLCFS